MALSYEFIASYTAPSNQTYITFSSIPSTYTHLYIKGNGRSSRNGGDDGSTQYYYNNSRAANYNRGSAFQYYATGLSSGYAIDQTANSIEGIPQVAEENCARSLGAVAVAPVLDTVVVPDVTALIVT